MKTGDVAKVVGTAALALGTFGSSERAQAQGSTTPIDPSQNTFETQSVPESTAARHVPITTTAYGEASETFIDEKMQQLQNTLQARLNSEPADSHDRERIAQVVKALKEFQESDLNSTNGMKNAIDKLNEVRRFLPMTMDDKVKLEAFIRKLDSISKPLTQADVEQLVQMLDKKMSESTDHFPLILCGTLGMMLMLTVLLALNVSRR